MATRIEADAQRLAELESTNQGKTIRLSRDSDLPATIDTFRFFAGASRVMDGIAAAEYWPGGTSMVRREPIGVVGSIAPWNYPIVMAAWKIAPALAAGNSVVLKPASITPLTALELGRLAKEAGIPDGVLNVVTGPGSDLGQAMAESPGIDFLSLTGGTETGSQLMSAASRTLKRVHLELGGKAPFIVFDDADIDAATSGAVVGALINGGQDCTAACRFILHEGVKDRFTRMLIEKLRRVRMGDPLDEDTDLGPLVSKDHLASVRGYIDAGLSQGARIAYLGEPIKD
jgi:betaine-aldehyde dehydrogenase